MEDAFKGPNGDKEDDEWKQEMWKQEMESLVELKVFGVRVRSFDFSGFLGIYNRVACVNIT